MESRTGLQLPVSWHSPFLAPRLNGTPGAGGAHGELRYWGIRFAFICLPAARSVLGAQPGEPSPHVLCPGLAQWVTKGTDAGTQGWVSGGCCLPGSPRSLGSLRRVPTHDSPLPWLRPEPVPAPGGRKRGLPAGRDRPRLHREERGARGRPGTGVQRSRGAKSEPGGRGNFWCERSNRGSDVCLMFRGRFDALIRESSASPIHHSSSSAIQTPL